MPEAKDTFSLSWCEKHKNWWVTNCPDCMVDSNEEDIKRQAIRKVMEWTAKEFGVDWSEEKEQLEKWGIEL